MNMDSEIMECNKSQDNTDTMNSLKSTSDDVKPIKSFSSPSSQFTSPTHQHNFRQMGPGVCYPCCINPHFQYPDQHAVHVRPHMTHECSPPRIPYPHINPQMYAHPFALQHPGYQVQHQMLNMPEAINSVQRLNQPADLRFSNPHILDPLFNPYTQYLPPHQNSDYISPYPAFQHDPYYYEQYPIYEAYATLPSYQINCPYPPQYRYAHPHTHESGYHSDSFTPHNRESSIIGSNSEVEKLTNMEDNLLRRVLSPSESFNSPKTHVVDGSQIYNCLNSDKSSDKSSNKSLTNPKGSCDVEDYYFEDKLVDKPNVGIMFGDHVIKNNNNNIDSFNVKKEEVVDNLNNGVLLNEDTMLNTNPIGTLNNALDYFNQSTQSIDPQIFNETRETMNSDVISKSPVSYSLELGKPFCSLSNPESQVNKFTTIKSPIAYSFDLNTVSIKDDDDKCFVKPTPSYSVDIVRFNADGTSVDETKLENDRELNSESNSDILLERNQQLIKKVEGLISERIEANLGLKQIEDDIVITGKKMDNLNHGSYSPPERDVTSDTKKDSLAFTIDFGSDDGKPEISANWKNFKDFKPGNSRKFGNRSDSLDHKKNRHSYVSDGNASAISNDQEDEPTNYQNLETHSAKNTPNFFKSINKSTKQILKQHRSYSQPNAKDIIPRVQASLSKTSPLTKNTNTKTSSFETENAGYKNKMDKGDQCESLVNKRLNGVKGERYYGERSKGTVSSKGYKDSGIIDNKITSPKHRESEYLVSKSKHAMSGYGNVSESKLKPSQRLSTEALKRSEGCQGGIDVKGYLMRKMLNQGMENDQPEVEAVSRLSLKIGDDERSEAGTYTIDKLDSNILSPVNHREFPEHIFEEEEDLKNADDEENIENLETRICGETDFGTFTMTFDAPKKRPSPKPCSQTVDKNIASLESKKDIISPRHRLANNISSGSRDGLNRPPLPQIDSTILQKNQKNSKDFGNQGHQNASKTNSAPFMRVNRTFALRCSKNASDEAKRSRSVTKEGDFLRTKSDRSMSRPRFNDRLGGMSPVSEILVTCRGVSRQTGMKGGVGADSSLSLCTNPGGAFMRSDGGRFSMRSDSNPRISANRIIVKKDIVTSSDKPLSQESTAWKRRKSYDARKSVAESRSQAARRKDSDRSSDTQLITEMSIAVATNLHSLAQNNDNPTLTYDTNLVQSIQQVSKKVQSLADNLIGKVGIKEDLNYLTQKSPSEGQACPELSSILENLKRTELHLQEVHETLFKQDHSRKPVASKIKPHSNHDYESNEYY